MRWIRGIRNQYMNGHMLEKMWKRNDVLMMIDGVIATPVPSGKWDFSNYFVDIINGQVWSIKNERWLVANPNSNGYCYVGLVDAKTGKSKSFGVHRVVMASASGLDLELFKRGGIEVDHINEVEWDNGIENLQMTDRKGQYRESTIRRMSKPKPRLKESEACEILEQLVEWKENEENKISDFIWMMSEAYGIAYRGMWNLVYGKSYKYLHENLHTSTI